MSTAREHYVKTVRDAAAPLDSLIHRLVDEGHAFALLRTTFKLQEQHVGVEPDAKDRDIVFGLAVEEFTKAGWGYGSTTLSADEDPARPVVAMLFRHPRTNTRLGEEPEPKGRSISYNIATPPVGTKLTTEVIDWYAQQAADITRGILAQRAVDETGGMPDHSVIVPVKVYDKALTPQALHTAPLLTTEEATEGE